jgi:hypothetical protein
MVQVWERYTIREEARFMMFTIWKTVGKAFYNRLMKGEIGDSHLEFKHVHIYIHNFTPNKNSPIRDI